MFARKFILGLALVLLCIPLATLFHELVGHGLTGVLLGGHLRRVDVLWFELWPKFSLHGWAGYYGQCHVEGIPTRRGENLMLLGGSMSTLLAAAFALFLLRIHRWGPITSACLQVIGLWWIDLLTYTLPTWGIRRSVLWGGRVAEPYQAAIALGIPGHVFQGFVIVVSLIMAWKWVWTFGNPRGKKPPFMFAPPRRQM